MCLASKRRRFSLDTPSIKDKLKELENRRGHSENFQAVAEKYSAPEPREQGFLRTTINKAGGALLHMGLMKVAMRFFPGLASVFTPVVSVAYERVRKNTDLPGLVDEATEKLKDIQHERAQKKILEDKQN